MKSFLVSLHDASPAFEREVRVMLRGMRPLVGRRLSLGVVPDWHGAWPLARHGEFCAFMQGNADELLLHGLRHRRARGTGPVSWLTGGSDEMNGMDAERTRETLARGQSAFTAAFGVPARGFLPPAWQPGYATSVAGASGIEHVLGYSRLRAIAGESVRLATWSWDCGRWSWLGHAGHAIGAVMARGGGVPVLAIHPADLQRGFWPRILELTRSLIARGFEPRTCEQLLEVA